MATKIIPCNVISDSPFVKVDLNMYWENYMGLGFDGYLDFTEGMVKIKRIKPRTGMNKNTVQVITVENRSYICRKHGTVHMTRYDLKQAKQAVKDKKKAEKYIMMFGSIQEKINTLMPYNADHHADVLESVAAADQKEAEMWAENNPMLVEEYIVSEKENGQTLADYCYEMYEEWLSEWIYCNHPTAAARSNQWRERFLHFSAVKAE